MQAQNTRRRVTKKRLKLIEPPLMMLRAHEAKVTALSTARQPASSSKPASFPRQSAIHNAILGYVLVKQKHAVPGSPSSTIDPCLT